jgi:hypothetical protein
MQSQEYFGKLNFKSCILSVSGRVKYLSKIGFSLQVRCKIPFPYNKNLFRTVDS